MKCSVSQLSQPPTGNKPLDFRLRHNAGDSSTQTVRMSRRQVNSGLTCGPCSPAVAFVSFPQLAQVNVVAGLALDQGGVTSAARISRLRHCLSRGSSSEDPSPRSAPSPYFVLSSCSSWAPRSDLNVLS
jgi:hypothetical protein